MKINTWINYLMRMWHFMRSWDRKKTEYTRIQTVHTVKRCEIFHLLSITCHNDVDACLIDISAYIVSAQNFFVCLLRQHWMDVHCTLKLIINHKSFISFQTSDRAYILYECKKAHTSISTLSDSMGFCWCNFSSAPVVWHLRWKHTYFKFIYFLMYEDNSSGNDVDDKRAMMMTTTMSTIKSSITRVSCVFKLCAYQEWTLCFNSHQFYFKLMFHRFSINWRTPHIKFNEIIAYAHRMTFTSTNLCWCKQQETSKCLHGPRFCSLTR